VKVDSYEINAGRCSSPLIDKPRVNSLCKDSVPSQLTVADSGILYSDFNIVFGLREM